MKLRALLGLTYATLIVVLAFALVFRYFGTGDVADPKGMKPRLSSDTHPRAEIDLAKPMPRETAESGILMQSKFAGRQSP